MLLLGTSTLDKFMRKHRDAAAWLADWANVVRRQEWKSLADVRRSFAHADGVKLRSWIVVTVFNVKGNEYRLLTSIDYEAQRVQVLDLLTHAEYSRVAGKIGFSPITLAYSSRQETE